MSEPKDFDIESLDAIWVDRRSPGLFNLDLSEAKYVSHRALLYIVAFTRRRYLRNQATNFKLPRDKRVMSGSGRLDDQGLTHLRVLLRDLEPVAAFDLYGDVHTQYGRESLLPYYKQADGNLTMTIAETLGIALR